MFRSSFRIFSPCFGSIMVAFGIWISLVKRTFRSRAIEGLHGIKVPTIWPWESHATCEPPFRAFELNNPCVDVKIVTLRDISTLGNQMYGLEALNPTRNECMDLDYGGLDELSIQLGELCRGSPTFYVTG